VKPGKSQVREYMPVISALGKLRWEGIFLILKDGEN
jgi:hypothetical protein